jgi:hypothetical protein
MPISTRVSELSLRNWQKYFLLRWLRNFAKVLRNFAEISFPEMLFPPYFLSFTSRVRICLNILYHAASLFALPLYVS